MDKLGNLNEVLYHLKDKQILTTRNKDQFVYKKEKIYRYFNGSCIVLSLDDFIELYGDETFCLYEDDTVFIDEEKDEDYYRYYRK